MPTRTIIARFAARRSTRLSEDASDKEAAVLAEKENMSDVIAGVDLTGENSPVASILIDLAQRDTMNRSVRFAETVLTSLPPATMVRPTSPAPRGRVRGAEGARHTGRADVELGYLTNTKERGRNGDGCLARHASCRAGAMRA